MMDYNWLLSTSAQSAAAIVAIVAGFILSRVLSLSADRSGIESRLNDIRNNLRFKSTELKEISERIVRWDAQDFLESVADRLAETRGEIALEELIEESNFTGLSKEELEPYYDKAIEITQRAYELFLKHPFKSEPPQTVGNYLEQIKIKVPDEELTFYHPVYQLFRKHYRSRRRDAFGVSGMGLLSDDSVHIAFSPVARARIEKYNQLVKEQDALRAEVKWLKSQEDDLLQKSNHMGRPKGLWLGVIALIYFSISGIIIPIVWLPVASERFTPTYKWIVVACFVSGLLFVLGYLIWSIWHLSKKV